MKATESHLKIVPIKHGLTGELNSTEYSALKFSTGAITITYLHIVIEIL